MPSVKLNKYVRRQNFDTNRNRRIAHTMKISIITATYNSESTIRHTIESVLMQTHKDIEYIIVDGASTDGTMSIVKEYAPLFGDKLKYISEKDKGLYDAMNKGIGVSTGDIVGILNSDDFYTTTTILERVNNELQNTEIDTVYGDVHYVNSDNLHKCTRYYSSKPFCRGIMRMGFMPAHPSFYCRKSCYDKAGGFNLSYKVAADFELLLRILYINKARTKYMNTDFVTMRAGGVSNAGIESHKNIMCDHLKALRAHGIYSNFLILSLRYIYKIFELIAGNMIYKKDVPKEISFIDIYDGKTNVK